MINGGANINTIDNKGRTILIDLASISFKDIESMMDRASTKKVVSDMTQMVKLLLENGADPNIRDDKNKTALMEAKEKGHSEIAKLLIQAGVKE